MRRFRVELLGDGVVVHDEGGTPTAVPGDVAAPLAATLAMNAGRVVSSRSLFSHMTSRTANALQKRMSRLREAGMPIDLIGEGYRLSLADDDVDARWYILQAKKNEHEHTYASVCEALSVWWSDPLTVLPGNAIWKPLYLARTTLEDLRFKMVPRRLLIVEDRVGERLSRILGRYECTVVRDLGGFWERFPHLDRDFDAVLVDLHLGGDYRDNDGTVVVEAISRSRSAVPTIVMTFSPLVGWDITAYQRRYNVAAVVTKGGDDDSADFSAVADAVHRLFDEDVHSSLVNAIEDDLPRIGRYAEKWLTAQGRSADVPFMRAEHERLYSVARKRDLAELRVAVDRFRSKYGSPAAPRDVGG